MSGERDLTDFEQKMVADVREHGCHILHVFDPDGKEPDFSYSIGFPETVFQPEVITFSLPRSLMASMINETWRQISEDGLQLADGLRVGGLIEGHDCIAREITDVTAIADHFGSAIWYHRTQRHKDIDRAFQLVWPGARQGLFPWESGCVQDVIDDQPILYTSNLNS